MTSHNVTKGAGIEKSLFHEAGVTTQLDNVYEPKSRLHTE